MVIVPLLFIALLISSLRQCGPCVPGKAIPQLTCQPDCAGDCFVPRNEENIIIAILFNYEGFQYLKVARQGLHLT